MLKSIFVVNPIFALRWVLGSLLPHPALVSLPLHFRRLDAEVLTSPSLYKNEYKKIFSFELSILSDITCRSRSKIASLSALICGVALLYFDRSQLVCREMVFCDLPHDHKLLQYI